MFIIVCLGEDGMMPSLSLPIVIDATLNCVLGATAFVTVEPKVLSHLCDVDDCEAIVCLYPTKPLREAIVVFVIFRRVHVGGDGIDQTHDDGVRERLQECSNYRLVPRALYSIILVAYRIVQKYRIGGYVPISKFVNYRRYLLRNIRGALPES